ncbi:MAG: type II secretion system F family protein [Campylobacterota bacterium]|nr:type II secretion system F family protein [Campylobacterota bacterium]
MIYAYKGIDFKGSKVHEKVEAASLEEAKSKLKAQQIIYESIKEERPSLFEGIHFTRRYHISSKELAQLSRELATYIRSGITIVSALKIAQSHYAHNKKLHLFLKTLNVYLDEGKNFYNALRSQSIVVLPEFYVQSIKVSESSGILDEVLLELARFLKEQDSINKEVRSAFAYPLFMLVVSLLMVGFMLTFVVPQITNIFANMDQELPGVTTFVIAAGEFFNNNYIVILILVTAVISLNSLLRRYNEGYRYKTDRVMMKMPIFGSIVIKSELGRFAYIGALLVRSGIPFVQTIKLSSNILDNRVLKKIFGEAAQKVVEGKRLSTALNESKIAVDAAFVQAIALGEETSEVEPVLNNLAELYFEENRDKVGLLLTLLEPLLMLIVGGVIGFIVAAMLLPIFSMSIS